MSTMSLPEAKGRQKEVLALPYQGTYVVLGTAGSGKTTMAIHRALLLADLCAPGEKVLLTTFNKALAGYLGYLNEDQVSRLDILNYHKWARWFLINNGCFASDKLVNPNMQQWVKRILMNKQRQVKSSILNKDAGFFIDEFQWIQRMGITDAEEYLNIPRIGRSEKLEKNARTVCFELYKEYLHLRNQEGYKCDWGDMAGLVVNTIESGKSNSPYRHVIIDEGQDFSPMMLKSLAMIIPQNGSLLYFGDNAQQIYGRRISWRKAGLRNPRIWRFEQNYRNSRPITELAVAISNHPYFIRDEDLVYPHNSRAEGPKPTLVSYRSEADEINAIVRVGISESRTRRLAILVRTSSEISRLTNALIAAGRKPELIAEGNSQAWSNVPGISVGTYHSAKGLEFESVFLPFCSNAYLPCPRKVESIGNVEDAMVEEIKLLYVGVTRARSRLVLSFTDTVTDLLPSNNELYQRLER